MWNYTFLMSIIQALARYANPQVLVNHFPSDASVVTVVTRWTGQGLSGNDIWETDCLQRITPQPGAITVLMKYPHSKVHGANMGPIWGLRDPGGPHVGPKNVAIGVDIAISQRPVTILMLINRRWDFSQSLINWEILLFLLCVLQNPLSSQNVCCWPCNMDIEGSVLGQSCWNTGFLKAGNMVCGVVFNYHIETYP